MRDRALQHVDAECRAPNASIRPENDGSARYRAGPCRYRFRNVTPPTTRRAMTLSVIAVPCRLEALTMRRRETRRAGAAAGNAPGLLAHSSSQGEESVRHGARQMGKRSGRCQPGFFSRKRSTPPGSSLASSNSQPVVLQKCSKSLTRRDRWRALRGCRRRDDRSAPAAPSAPAAGRATRWHRGSHRPAHHSLFDLRDAPNLTLARPVGL